MGFEQGGLLGVAEPEAAGRPRVDFIVVNRAPGRSSEQRGVVGLLHVRDDAVGFSEGGGEAAVGGVDEDFLVVGCHDQSSIVEDLKGGNPRRNGRAADACVARCVVLVGSALTGEERQPEFPFVVDDGIVDSVDG